jgi:hypothetical protein
MFFFGSLENTRELYLSQSMSVKGPNLPSTSFDELNVKEQKILFAYVYMAYSSALRDGLSEGDISAVRDLYDETFTKMAQSHPDFREAVMIGRHVYLPDYTEETLEKYRGIVSASQKP